MTDPVSADTVEQRDHGGGASCGEFNEHPFYAEGWFDARDGEPLFPDATPEYTAGWRGWYAAKEALARMLANRDDQPPETPV